MSKHSYELERLTTEHVVRCCGDEFAWPGKAPVATFVCRKCGGVMKVEERTVRTEVEAELALRGAAYVEDCADCGAKHGHHLVAKDGAVFLVCGACGEELRELDKKEIG